MAVRVKRIDRFPGMVGGVRYAECARYPRGLERLLPAKGEYTVSHTVPNLRNSRIWRVLPRAGQTSISIAGPCPKKALGEALKTNKALQTLKCAAHARFSTVSSR